MGCLFGKKQQESEVEINLQGSLSLKPKPFNEINDIKFLGYPHYATLTAFVNTLLENNINTWLPYKQQLIDHQIKIDKYLEILNGLISRLPNQEVLQFNKY